MVSGSDDGSPRPEPPSLAVRFSRAVRAFRGAGAPDRPAAATLADEIGDEASRVDDPTRSLIARMSRAHLSGELAERATHEIGNHLQVVLGNAELLSLAATLSDDSRRRLAWITEAGRDAAAVNGTLREFSRHDCGRPEGAAETPLSLGEALTRIRPALEWLVSPAHLDTTVGPDVGTVRLSAAAPPDLLCELLLRLARETSVASGDTITLRARLLGTRPNALLRLGIGIDAPGGTRTSASPRRDADTSDGEGDEFSLDILAALAGLAGGRLDAGASTPSPPDLLLPVAREAIDP